MFLTCTFGKQILNWFAEVLLWITFDILLSGWVSRLLTEISSLGLCRGYFKCSSWRNCPARKHVERCLDDPSMVVVTYEDEHTHPKNVIARPTTPWRSFSPILYTLFFQRKISSMLRAVRISYGGESLAKTVSLADENLVEPVFLDHKNNFLIFELQT